MGAQSSRIVCVSRGRSRQSERIGDRGSQRRPVCSRRASSNKNIPIVFLMPGDPVQEGLVASLSRPGGNLTGVTVTNTVLIRKQIELLNELLPGSSPLAIVFDPNTEVESLRTNVQAAEQTLGRHVILVNAASPNEFDTAFETIVLNKASGLIVPDRPLFISRHDQLAGWRRATVYRPSIHLPIWHVRAD